MSTSTSKYLPVVAFSEDADMDTFLSLLSGWTVEITWDTGSVTTGTLTYQASHSNYTLVDDFDKGTPSAPVHVATIGDNWPHIVKVVVL